MSQPDICLNQTNRQHLFYRNLFMPGSHRENDRIREQISVIERVCRDTGLSYEDLAEHVMVKPETMRKLRKGYQPASPQLLRAIKNVSSLRSVRVRESAKGGKDPLAEQIEFILQHGTLSEVQTVQAMIDAAYKQIRRRGPAKPSKYSR
jgi:ribosome-binding protein aMBF1 (putative translation factor)